MWKPLLSISVLAITACGSSESEARYELADCGGLENATCGPGYACSYDRDENNDGIAEGTCVRPTGCGGGYASPPEQCPAGYQCEGEADADNDGILEPGTCVEIGG